MMTRTATILLVDDERLVLRALRRLLAPSGHRILEAEDAEQALAALAHETVDVILSDIDMPGMSGIDMVAMARTICPDAVRILMTGKASLEAAHRAINHAEVFRYILKPWDNGDLAEVMAQALARRAELESQGADGGLRRQREQLRAELERSHPGITTVPDTGDVYAIDPERVARALASAAVGPRRQSLVAAGLGTEPRHLAQRDF